MKILVQIIDALFPPRPTQLIVRSTTSADIQHRYQTQHTNDSICISAYQDPLIKALITENKFYANTLASRHLAMLLEQWLSSQSGNLVLIPIPLSKKRERERGYNQVTAVLDALSLQKTIVVDTTILTRTKHTTAQTSLQRSERLKNLIEAFTANKEAVQSYTDSTFVIVDDVLTTGATMTAAKAALSLHVHPTTAIRCIALAH